MRTAAALPGVDRVPLRRRVPPYGLSLPLRGMLFLFGTTLIGLAAVDAGINLLLIIFGVCLGAILLSSFSGWRALRRVRVRRQAPDNMVAGRVFEIRYAVHNESRWTWLHDVHLHDVVSGASIIRAPEGFVHSLRPGERTYVTVPVRAASRGRIRLNAVRVSTSFPFGIFTKSVLIPLEDELVVFPPLARLLGPLEQVSRRSEAAAHSMAPGRTKGDEEFYGVREFRAGDNPKRIHWRRSARTGQLMVREMSKPRDHQVWCVINTQVPPRDGRAAALLEQAVSAAATALCHALESGSRVGLICNGEPLLVLPPGGGRAHRPRLLRELALRGENVGDPLAHHLRRVAWPARWRGICYLFGAQDHEDLRAAARELGRSIGPTSVFVPSSAAFEGAFDLGWAEGTAAEDGGASEPGVGAFAAEVLP